MTRIYLERGRTWTFACALDWPGWARRAKGGDEAAIESLLGHAPRYADVVGPDFRVGDLVVVGHVEGTTTTDFGAPDARGPWDDEPLDAAEADRLASLLEAAWEAFDVVVAGAPPSLHKGPRGGGRDRDKIADHVREAERSYGRKLAVRVPPRTPWAQQRAEIAAAHRSGSSADWPVRYAVRRCAWHVLDHAWEIQDRTPP